LWRLLLNSCRWTIPILWRGNQKELSQDDIPNIQAHDETENLVHTFDSIWNKEAQSNGGSHSLRRALFKMFGLRFITTVLIVCFQQCIIRYVGNLELTEINSL